ncbi:hypothetical protein V8D89_010741 [Ganoderma adspersum]
MSLQTPCKAECANNCYPPIANITDLAAEQGKDIVLPLLKGLLYAVGLNGSLKNSIINPAHWDPSTATSIHGYGSSWVLAIDGQSGSHHAVVATFGTVLQSDIIKSTLLTMFDKYEFNLSIFCPKIMGASEMDRIHSLQIRSWPSEKTMSAPQAVGGGSQSEGNQASRSGSAASPD